MMEFRWAEACCIKTIQYTKRASLWITVVIHLCIFSKVGCLT